jgi:hypothetical protein
VKKFVFLDIDGVLNSHQFYLERSQSERYKIMGYPLCDLDPEKLKLLDDLIDDTQAHIVISSTWRNKYSIEDFKTFFSTLGFKNSNNIIDKTPKLFFQSDSKHSVPRGCEIFEWLEVNTEYEEVYTYVIFDDDSDMMYWQRNNFIWVDGYCGLTPTLIYKAKNILNKII